jgi:hypothetical protein
MDIVTAMAEITRRQGLLSITSPIPATIKVAWLYYAPSSIGMVDVPFVMNSCSFTGIERTAGQFIRHYSIHTQLFASIDVDGNRAAEISGAFMVAYENAFGPHPTLNGLVTDQQIRGGSPTFPMSLEWAGVKAVGLDLFMDLTLKDPMTFDAS